MAKATWLTEPEEHDYPAAAAYLALLVDEPHVAATVAALRAADVITVKAKDLLRASRLPALGDDNHHVRHDLKRIDSGTPLSPLLLVRGDMACDRPLVIADGYHRMCAAYHADEDLDVPCKLVSLR